MFRKKVAFVLLFSIVLISKGISAEEVYSPYPIVFVHGFNADSQSWEPAKKDYFGKYFVDFDGYPKYPYKHFFGYMENFPVCNYGAQKNGTISRNGSIPHIARAVLKQSIDNAIDAAFPDGYQGEKKVNIVAHSMGGLVVRSLLTQYHEYQGKINKVIFIGTPHKGTPYASGLWIINKEEAEILPPLIDSYSNAYSKTVGTLNSFIPQTAFLTFQQASLELQQRLNRDDAMLLAVSKAGIAPNGYAVEQMRLPFNCSYHDEIEGKIGFKYVRIPIDIDYQAGTTFLGQGVLSTPNDFLTIRGKNLNPENIFNWAIDILNGYREGVPFGFNFPSGYTINEAKSPGDGFVTQESQYDLGGEVKEITAIHTEEGTNLNTFKYILEKLEDKPQIERIKVIALDESQRAPNMDYYIVVKIKEYLLADIELEYMELDGEDIIPENFEYNKPYNAYPDKGFLKSRDGPEVTDILGNKTKLKLEPGEFFVQATLSPGVNTLDLKIKNPAEEIAQDDTFTDEVTAYLSRPIIGDVYFTFGDYPPTSYGWGIDVPPYDEDREPFIDGLKDSGTLSQFTITDEAETAAQSENMSVSASLYIDTPEGLKIRNPLVVLKSEEQVLNRDSGGYSKTVTNFTAWDGKDKNGNYVPEWSTSGVVYRLFLLAKPISADPYIYPHADPPVTKQLLIGTSWDTPFNDIISADPTFVQHSKELGIDFFSNDIQSRLRQRADRYRLSQRQTYEDSNYELASHLKELGAEKKVIAELESPAHPHKQNLTALSRIIP